MKKYAVLMLIICMLFCIIGCQNTDTAVEIEGEKTDKTAQISDNTKDSKDIIVLYYSDNQGMSLCKEEREVSFEDASDPRVVMEELMKGSSDVDLINVISSDVRLNGCKVEDGVCVVDLSEEFLKIQGTTAQEMAVYSVVNTLCHIDGVDSVRFLIDGKTVPVFGVFDFASTFDADVSLVK